jgi:hypothetical protein
LRATDRLSTILSVPGFLLFYGPGLVLARY